LLVGVPQIASGGDRQISTRNTGAAGASRTPATVGSFSSALIPLLIIFPRGRPIKLS
jgi:hypothetical protein